MPFVIWKNDKKRKTLMLLFQMYKKDRKVSLFDSKILYRLYCLMDHLKPPSPDRTKWEYN